MVFDEQMNCRSRSRDRDNGHRSRRPSDQKSWGDQPPMTESGRGDDANNGLKSDLIMSACLEAVSSKDSNDDDCFDDSWNVVNEMEEGEIPASQEYRPKTEPARIPNSRKKLKKKLMKQVITLYPSDSSDPDEKDKLRQKKSRTSLAKQRIRQRELRLRSHSAMVSTRRRSSDSSCHKFAMMESAQSPTDVETEEPTTDIPTIPLEQVDDFKTLQDKINEATSMEELEELYKNIHNDLALLDELEHIQKMTPGELSPVAAEPGEIVSDAENDELIELRLQALKSSKPKRKNCESPIVFTSPPKSPDEVQDKLFENDDMSIDSNESASRLMEAIEVQVAKEQSTEPASKPTSNNAVAAEPEEDTDELREQLLRSMLNKKKARALSQPTTAAGPSSSAEPSPLVSKQPEKQSPSVNARANSPSTPLSAIPAKKSAPNTEPKKLLAPPYKVKPLVIHFGSDSSDDEDEAPRATTSAQPQLSAAFDAFLKQARFHSQQQQHQTTARIIKKTRHTKIYQRQTVQPKVTTNEKTSIQHLSLSQQAEYVKLRERLLREEKIKKLQSSEAEYSKLKNALPTKTSKLTALKCKQNRKQLQFTEAQKRCREAYEAYLAADRILSKSVAELNTAKFDVKKYSGEIDNDKTSLVKIEQECRRLGQELKGSDYKLPNLNTVQTSVVENRERRAESVRKRKASESTGSGGSPRKRSVVDNAQQQAINDSRTKLQEMEKDLKNRMQMFEGITNPKTRPAEKKRQIEEFKAQEELKKSSVDEKAVAKLKESVERHLKLSAIRSLSSEPLNWTLNFMTFPKKLSPLKKKFALMNTLPGNDKENDLRETILSKAPTSHKNYESVLNHLHSYRLRQNESDLTNSSYANNVVPSETICRFDLLGSCSDKSCKMQHKSKYLYDNHEKIVDVLLYDPSVAKIIGTENIDSQTLRNRLLEFTKRFLKEPTATPTQLLKLIKNSDKVKTNDLVTLTRTLTRITQTVYTFNDYAYSFSITNSELVLTCGKAVVMKEKLDPDSNIKGRFFEPDRQSFENQLTLTLEKNPNDTQLWLKLAYHKLAIESQPKNLRLIEALDILRKAIDLNEKDAELWEQYLCLYSNARFEKKCPNVLDVCKQAVEVCPKYRLWKVYISHAKTIDEKIDVSRDLINSLAKRLVVADKNVDLSNKMLEAVCYRARLFLQIGRADRAETLLKNALFNSTLEIPAMDNALDVVKWVMGRESRKERSCLKSLPVISRRLTHGDRVTLWLCYFMMKCNHCLSCLDLEPLKLSYSAISSKKLLNINWTSLTSKTVRNEVLKAFAMAFDSCFVLAENEHPEKFDICAPLFINLWQFESQWRESSESVVTLFMEMLDYRLKIPTIERSRFFWLMLAEAQANGARGDAISTALSTIVQSKPYMSFNDQSFLYISAYLNSELKDRDKLKSELLKLIRPYTDDNLSQKILEDVVSIYQAVICESNSLDLSAAEIRTKYVKYPVRSAKLWLGYIFLHSMENASYDKMEGLFDSAINMCESSERVNEMQLLWFMFLKYLSQNVSTQRQFDNFVMRLKDCCIRSNDQQFQAHIIIYFSNVVVDDKDQVRLCAELVKLLSANQTLVSYFLRTSIKLKQEKIACDTLDELIHERKMAGLDDRSWKTLISIMILWEDHFRIHCYFQLATSSYPYSVDLWTLFLQYEKCHGHVEHQKMVTRMCEKLKLPIKV